GLAFYDEMKISGTPWILVGIDNNFTSQQRSKDILSRFVKDRYLTEVTYRPANYQKQADSKYGLEHYIVPLKDPKTDVPYDFGHLDDHLHDLFILRDKVGDIQTYMVCYIPTDVPNPPCRHKFFIRENGLDIVVSLNYSRHRLYDWHKIEQEVRKVMFDFVQNAQSNPIEPMKNK
ncbi:MAG: hypothetical protein Q4C98_11710, partial [Capnocytophaga sp.]|nr:hypothetical protein [Capnocytophaga sp.]